MTVNQFRCKVEGWLSRSVPERAINDCFGKSVALATDVGLERSENQDRVASMERLAD
jgi:hypothetical protein